MKVLDVLITLGAALLLAVLLSMASYYFLTGWLILLGFWVFHWIQSLGPLPYWVEPLGGLPGPASMAALWLTLVLETRRLMGFAEEPEGVTPFGHWSVQRSSAVFSLTTFLAWTVHSLACNVFLAVNSVNAFNIPLLAPIFAQQQLILIVGIGLAIAVPNYGYLPLVWLRSVLDSASSYWTAWRDYRLLGKEPREEKLRKQSIKRRTQRISVGASELGRFPSTSSTFRAVVAPTAFWLASAEGFGEELKGMSRPIVTIRREPCSVCGRNLDAEDKVLRCPHCSARAHQRHFLKWLKDNARCPRCRKPLTPYDLAEG